MNKRLINGGLFVALMIGLAGCQSPQLKQDRELPEAVQVEPGASPANFSKTDVVSAAPPLNSPPSRAATVDDPARLAQEDPRSYVQFSLSACEKLANYSVLFVRQERRGLFNMLQPAERIQTWFRRLPFSVRMKWLDPGIKYGESTFVEGRADGQVLFVPNDTPLNFPQRVYRVSPRTPVTWGECRYPVTDFGVELLMRQTLATIANDPGARLSYAGMMRPPGDERTAHCIRIDYSPKKHAAPIQKLYFEVNSHLPILTEMQFADGSIDTSYAYHDLRSDVVLNDDDFVLEYERARAAQTTAGSNP